jgi:diguanylate cyclase (GGDEF)-like protein
LTDAGLLAEEESLFDLLPVGIALVERGSIARCNRTLEQMLGYASGELAGKPFAALADSDALEGEVELRRKDGSRLWCRLSSRAAQNCTLVAFADVTEEIKKLRLAVDAADLYYWEWDAATDRMHWSRNPEGLPEPAGGTAQTWSEYAQMVHPDDRERYLATGRGAVARGVPFDIEYRIATADGRLVWFGVRGVPMFDPAGKVYRMVGVSQDVTARKRREDAVRFLAYHDSLTGLPNRRLLDDRLKQAVHLAQRRDRKVAAMLIDLDNFKQVNDLFGHRAGDAVLKEVAQRLAACVRRADTLARHGGDEFVVVISEVNAEADCQMVADKILRALAAEFRVDGRALTLGASIGISLYPADAGDGDALLRNADAAMYRAKQLGRNQYRFYGR